MSSDALDAGMQEEMETAKGGDDEHQRRRRDRGLVG